jgi:Icc protein
VTWGHVHQELDSERGTVRLFATPSTGAQFLPKSERFAVDSRPPAYRPFALHPDGRIETQVRWVHAMPMRHVAGVR